MHINLMAADGGDVPVAADISVSDGARIVDERSEIQVEFIYPLSQPHVFSFTRDGGWTLGALVDAIRQKYREIYTEEDRTKTAGHSVGPLNRPLTNGAFGIWGHDISDLIIEGMVRRNNGVWHLHMGS